MTRIRVGTRGSALALWQADWASNQLLKIEPELEIERVIVKTTGDADQESSFGTSWPVGAFVSALEVALLEGRIDVAVHSLKDLQTNPTTGLVVAATPARGPAHDVLLTRKPARIEDLQAAARIGTSSPRTPSQLLEIGDFEIVPIRGNVPTRIAKLEEDDLDGVVLAAAGIQRLGIVHPNTIALPIDSFLPAPGQGALAIQTRADGGAYHIAGRLNDDSTRTAVTAERAFLQELGAGCHTPVGALAEATSGTLSLHGKLFSDDGTHVVEGTEIGSDPVRIGLKLARRLLAELPSR